MDDPRLARRHVDADRPGYRTEMPLGNGIKAVAAGVDVRLPDGRNTQLMLNAYVPSHLTLTSRVTQGVDCTVLELVDADGQVQGHTSVAHGAPAAEPWPRTQTIPSRVWVRLEHADIEVFQETGGDATLTVTEDGEVFADFPLKVRVVTEPNYDSWGDDE